MKIKKSIIIVLLAVLIIALSFIAYSYYKKSSDMLGSINTANRYIDELRALSGIGVLGSTHMHADIAVYVEGKKLDFSRPEYQVRANSVHVEDGKGDIVHVHATGITLWHFFRSLGMELTSQCIKLEDGKDMCNDGKKTLKLYVNGVPNTDYGSYEINDLDRILVSYGAETGQQIKMQIESVTGLAKEQTGMNMGSS